MTLMRDFLRQERDRERVELAHLALREILPGTAVGRALPAAPTGRRRGQGEGVSFTRPAPNGRHLVLRGGPYVPDGSPIEWHTIVRHLGWPVSTPITEIPYLAEGYYDAKLTGRFVDGTDWKGDVTAEVRIGGESRYPTPETFYACGEGLGAGPWMLGGVRPDQKWEIRLTADTIPTSAQQTLPELETIEASMQLVDSQVGEVNEPQEVPEVRDEFTFTDTSSDPATAWADIPETVEAGDTVCVFFVCRRGSATPTTLDTASGWTRHVEILSPRWGGATTHSATLYMFSKVAGPGDAGTRVHFARNGGTNVEGLCFAFVEGRSFGSPDERLDTSSDAVRTETFAAAGWQLVIEGLAVHTNSGTVGTSELIDGVELGRWTREAAGQYVRCRVWLVEGDGTIELSGIVATNAYHWMTAGIGVS